MSVTQFIPYERIRTGVPRYVLRRCEWCRKFLGIVLTEGYHSVGKILCPSCREGSQRSRTGR